MQLHGLASLPETLARLLYLDVARLYGSAKGALAGRVPFGSSSHST